MQKVVKLSLMIMTSCKGSAKVLKKNMFCDKFDFKTRTQCHNQEQRGFDNHIQL